jgi:hypothetical protein
MTGFGPICRIQLTHAHKPSQCARYFNRSYPPDDWAVALVKRDCMSSIALTNTEWHQRTRIPKCGSRL